ncbi:MAG: adenosylmethionine--8-amino-7-oxononanoate transaminase [Polyangiaceae bacterium]
MSNDRARIVELDKRHVWHPYTPMQEWIERTEPLVIVRADGSRLFEADGRSFLDGNSSWWTAALGHGHPRLNAALRRQAETLGHVPLAGIAHESAALLAQELVAVAPAGLSRVFFSDDGSTAVEVAMKLALQLWHQNGRPARRRFIALEGAFHGETLGATALGGVELFRRPFAECVLDCIHVPWGDGGFERAFDTLEQAVEAAPDEIAAVVLEPVVQGAAGMRSYDPELLRRARAVTRRHDILLILDEVFTGYGRTGPMWASEHAGVVPDVMCVAKAFSGGLLPMAATLVSEPVFSKFLGDPTRAFLYGHTFAGNPLGAAVAREVLAIYRDERILELARPKHARIARAFAELSAIPGVATTRALGMIGALELEEVTPAISPAPAGVYDAALERGAYLRPSATSSTWRRR